MCHLQAPCSLSARGGSGYRSSQAGPHVRALEARSVCTPAKLDRRPKVSPARTTLAQEHLATSRYDFENDYSRLELSSKTYPEGSAIRIPGGRQYFDLATILQDAAFRRFLDTHTELYSALVSLLEPHIPNPAWCIFLSSAPLLSPFIFARSCTHLRQQSSFPEPLSMHFSFFCRHAEHAWVLGSVIFCAQSN